MKTTILLFPVCWLLPATVLDAGVRTSASLTLSAENTQSGTPRQSAGPVVADTASAPVGGTSRSSRFLARFGHAGQLYDVTGGTLLANPSPVPESTATQLTVLPSLDDGTTLPGSLPVSAWQVVSGPVASISSGGLAQMTAVWMTTPAVIRATLAGAVIEGQVMVLDTIPDNFGGVAGDGLDDLWQMTHFDPDGDGVPELPAGPAHDADGDGTSNWDEWLAGTDPTAPLDWFRLEMSVPGPEGVPLRFGPVLANRRYVVLGRANLSAAPVALLTIDPEAGAPWHEVLLPPSGSATGFYQIRIEAE